MPKTAKNATGPDARLSARLVHALNHPLRIRILERLMHEDSSASRLAEAFGEPVPNVSYHLCRVLFEECALVSVTERHQRRGAEERVFALKREPFLEVVRFSTTALVALESQGADKRQDGLAAWHASVAVDDRGKDEIGRAMEAFASTVKTVGDRCADADAGQLRRLAIGTAAFAGDPAPGGS